MKTEGEFNAFISKELKKRKDLLAIKTADKYRAGLSDFIILCQANTVAIESKFIKNPVDNCPNILAHPFSPVQLAFLKRVSATGCGAWGLIAVKQNKTMYLVLERQLAEKMSLVQVESACCGRFEISPEGVRLMAVFLFGEE